MVTAKETVIQAFRGEKPEKVPIGIFIGGSWPIIHAGWTLEKLIGDAETTAEILYRTNKRLDADLMTVGTGSVPLMIRALGGEVRFSPKGSPDVLSELIKNESNLERLNINRALDDPAIQWIRDYARILFQLAGQEQLILANCRGPFTLAGQIFGVEQLCRAVYKNPEIVRRLLEFTTKLLLGFFTPMLADGYVDGVIIADPTASGDLISREHFKALALPYLRHVVREVKLLGGFCMVHICGNISDRLELMAETGLDCLSLDSKVNIAGARVKIGSRICLAGNVDPVNVLQFGTTGEIQTAVADCLNQGATAGRFMLLPGCDLGAKVPEENIRAFVSAGRQWIS
jgi:uroporphyrinogen decarboxylase